MEAQKLTLEGKGHFCEKLWEGCTVITQQMGQLQSALQQKVWALGRSIFPNHLANAPSSVTSQHNTVSRGKAKQDIPPGLGLSESCISAAAEHTFRQESFLSGVGHPFCHPLLKQEVRYLLRYWVWWGLVRVMSGRESNLNLQCWLFTVLAEDGRWLLVLRVKSGDTMQHH